MRETLKFSDFAIESGSSGLRLTGKIDDLKTFETEAKVSIDKLAPADVATFVPQWPVKAKYFGDGRSPRTAHGAEGRFFPVRGGWLFSQVTFRRM